MRSGVVDYVCARGNWVAKGAFTNTELAIVGLSWDQLEWCYALNDCADGYMNGVECAEDGGWLYW